MATEQEAQEDNCTEVKLETAQVGGYYTTSNVTLKMWPCGVQLGIPHSPSLDILFIYFYYMASQSAGNVCVSIYIYLNVYAEESVLLTKS